MPAAFLRASAAALLVALSAPPVLAHDTDSHAQVEVGPLVLTQGFSRATRPGAPVAGGFLTIANTGSADDRLIGASSAVAGHMEVHEMAMADGVMRMRELDGGLPIPAGATVTLQPGGFHVMFMELKQPLVEGETVDVTLVFEKAGEVTLPLAILAPDARALEAGH
jgi:copper(I)-binding protein